MTLALRGADWTIYARRGHSCRWRLNWASWCHGDRSFSERMHNIWGPREGRPPRADWSPVRPFHSNEFRGLYGLNQTSPARHAANKWSPRIGPILHWFRGRWHYGQYKRRYRGRWELIAGPKVDENISISAEEADFSMGTFERSYTLTVRVDNQVEPRVGTMRAFSENHMSFIQQNNESLSPSTSV